jgi:hypothetical protein
MDKMAFFYFLTASLMIVSILALQSVAATTVIFNDSHNNLTVSIDAPDKWNSGAASAYIHKLNWTGYGLASMNDDFNAFFSITSLPPVANFALPMGQLTGMFSSLLSQYITVNDEYDVPFSDGSRGHAYSFSINRDQLGRLNSIFPSVNKPVDGVLITVQQQGQNYVILYFTDFGMLGQYTTIFQGILQSLKFQGMGGYSTVYDANETSGIGASISNGTLGYKTVYEHTMSPKTFTPEEQAAIDMRCNVLGNNYASLSIADRGWLLANC